MLERKEQIGLIHTSPKTPYKVVLAITGGGSECIGELLRYGGGSNTILEAIVPYNQKAFKKFIKGVPDKFCSTEAARDLAMAAFQRSIEFEGLENFRQLMGIGVTCSLSKDGEREHRSHNIYICVQTCYVTHDFNIDLTNFKLNRLQEEKLVSDSIINILSHYCGLEDLVAINQAKCNSPESWKLISGQVKVLSYKQSENYSDKLIFSGSFNPMHDSHRMIADEASKIMNKKVDLEICLHNVDKPCLNYFEIEKRKFQISKELEHDYIGDILFTSLPTFLSKSNQFLNSTFIVGWDTFIRIGDPKYADLKQVMEAFKVNDTRFLVFHRVVDGKSSQENVENDIKANPAMQDLLNFASIISAEQVLPPERSSTKIRQKSIK